MSNEWFYTQNGTQVPNPVSTSQLKQMASAGQLQPTDLIWQEGMAGWAPASSLKGLFPTAPAAPLASPAPQTVPPSGRPFRSGKNDSTKTGAPKASGLPEMHPLLVLLLTILTVGFFGLYYALKISTVYTAQASKRKADANGRPLGIPRHPGWVLVLSLLTLGYYFYYWAYVVIQECNGYTDRKDYNPRTEVSLMLIVPFYSLFVGVYRLPELIKRAQAQAGVKDSPTLQNTWIYLIPFAGFFTLSFASMVYQEALNQVWSTAS